MKTDKIQAKPLPQFFIKPSVADSIVRDPVTKRPLAAGGELKPVNSYWSRRKSAGEVEETTPPTPKKPSGGSPPPGGS